MHTTTQSSLLQHDKHIYTYTKKDQKTNQKENPIQTGKQSKPVNNYTKVTTINASPET